MTKRRCFSRIESKRKERDIQSSIAGSCAVSFGVVVQNKKHVRYGFISENVSYLPQNSQRNVWYRNTYSELLRTKVHKEFVRKQNGAKCYERTSAIPHIAAPSYEKVKHIWENQSD